MVQTFNRIPLRNEGKINGLLINGLLINGLLNIVNIEFHSESMEILQHVYSKGLVPNTRQSIELVKIQ